MRINVLGSFGAEIDGNEIPLGGPQQRLILALLVAAGGDLVTTDQLIDRIWGDDLPDTPRKTVQVYIANLRSAIGGDRTPIHTEGGGYRLVIEEDDVDANRFARLVTEARSQLRTHPRPAAEGLEEALGLWRGPPYADLSYVIARGEAEVILTRPDGTHSLLAKLMPGALVGEGALLTDMPRTATVRMTGPGRVLVLKREDLFAGADESLGDLVNLYRMRWRPRRKNGVTSHDQTNSDGETIVVLRDEGTGAYHRMAIDGRFIWDRLDGNNTIRDLTIAYAEQFGQFAPDRVQRLTRTLVERGFAVVPQLKHGTKEQRRGLVGRIIGSAMAAVSWTKTMGDVDALVSKWYRRVGRLAFSKVGAAVAIALAVAGPVIFVVSGPLSTEFIDEAGGTLLLLGVLPANAIGAILHEASHALAVKHYGRKVRKAGIGWYFITPVVFVDTSDMWLESRWRRALVSAVGPLTNLSLGGAAAVAALFVSSGVGEVLLWEFVLVSFYLALINLNPMMEYDGYHMLSDVLDRPNLREEAMGWIGTDFLPSLRRRGRGLRGHGVDLLYGALATGYMLLAALFVVVLYRVLIESFMNRFAPSVLAGGLAWFLALWVALTLIYTAWSQLKGDRVEDP